MGALNAENIKTWRTGVLVLATICVFIGCVLLWVNEDDYVGDTGRGTMGWLISVFFLIIILNWVGWLGDQYIFFVFAAAMCAVISQIFVPLADQMRREREIDTGSAGVLQTLIGCIFALFGGYISFLAYPKKVENIKVTPQLGVALFIVVLNLVGCILLWIRYDEGSVLLQLVCFIFTLPALYATFLILLSVIVDSLILDIIAGWLASQLFVSLLQTAIDVGNDAWPEGDKKSTTLAGFVLCWLAMLFGIVFIAHKVSVKASHANYEAIAK